MRKVRKMQTFAIFFLFLSRYCPLSLIINHWKSHIFRTINPHECVSHIFLPSVLICWMLFGGWRTKVSKNCIELSRWGLFEILLNILLEEILVSPSWNVRVISEARSCLLLGNNILITFIFSFRRILNVGIN